MNIGNKIMMLRKNNNMTQEQLAHLVGVTSPSVSKWETGNTMPDVALLAPIARALHTDINDLLSYHDTLTDNEVELFLEKVLDTCKDEGFDRGMEQAFGCLKEYPNCDYLKLRVASCVSAYAYTVDIKYTDDEYSKWTNMSLDLLEELAAGDYLPSDSEVKEAAMAALTAMYIQVGKLDEAEKLLLGIPKRLFDGNHMLQTIYMQQGKMKEATVQTQKNLLMDLQNIMIDLRSLVNIALKAESYDMAMKYAHKYYEFACLFPDSSPSEILVEISLKRKNIKQAVSYMKDLAGEILSGESDWGNSIYFNAISDNIIQWSSDAEVDIKMSKIKGILMDPLYELLRADEEGDAIIRELEQQLLSGH